MKMTRAELINALIQKNGYKSYLEIGVNTPRQPGWSHGSIVIDLKHGVDPNPKVGATYQMTSDEFFEKAVKMKYDIVFVDGLHLSEQVYRDIMNSLKWLNDGGTIVVHDCNPVLEKTQVREHTTGAWHGDVWKAILKLRMEEPGLSICTVNTDEGCGIIQKGNQKLFVPKNKDVDPYTFAFLNSNRKEVLNLINVKEFKKMLAPQTIVVRIGGGLGNQMFQYAFGKSLAVKNKTELVLDTSGLDPKKGEAKREFSLDIFNVRYRVATEKDFKTLKIANPANRSVFAKIGRKLLRMKESSKPLYERKIILEKGFAFDPDMLLVKGDHYIAGNWQSEKYFESVEKELRNDFAFKEKLDADFASVAKMIKDSNSVCVNVRRADYITNPKSNNKWGFVGEKYYKDATELIKVKVPNPKFFVFSDDIEWCKENLAFLKDVVFVSRPQEENKFREDLELMSLCSHYIIANSTFSWWAVWLNKNKEKIVIAPKKWFASGLDDSDLVPKDWLRL